MKTKKNQKKPSVFNMKTNYVKTDGWRGYQEPINAICGANNTGSWSDSPCPEKTCLNELNQVKTILMKNGIHYKQVFCETPNVFCMHGYIVVPGRMKKRAKKLIADLPEKTELLYLT
jgi:hypothetical protein